jgi:uncharacterized membrane protein
MTDSTVSAEASSSEVRTSEAPKAEAPPPNRMVIAVLSLVGFFVAFYLLAHTLGWTGPLVCGIGECSTVQSSPYAWVGPIPVSGIGLAGYVFYLILSVLGIQPGWRSSKVVAVLLLVTSTVGFAFSAYLTYLEAAVIHAWCQWCVISAILVTLIFVASLAEVGHLKKAHP